MKFSDNTVYHKVMHTGVISFTTINLKVWIKLYDYEPRTDTPLTRTITTEMLENLRR